jgi:membrane protease YdiL (CAAX protease family)
VSHGPPIAFSPPAPDAGEDPGFLRRFAGLPPSGFNRVTAVLAVLTAFFAVQIGILLVFIFDSGADTNAGKLAVQFMVVVGFVGTAIGFALSDAGGRMRGALDRFGLRRFTLSMLKIAVAAWFVYFLVQAGLGALLDPHQDDVTKELGTNDSSAISIAATALLVVAGAAVSEELLFRGVIFAGLRKSMSLWPAAVISSLLWALLHLAAANFAVVIVLAIFGLVLAWLYERTGSLWTPICAHAINNGLAVLALFLS